MDLSADIHPELEHAGGFLLISAGQPGAWQSEHWGQIEG